MNTALNLDTSLIINREAMKAETLPAVTEMFFPSVDEENAPLTLAMWYIKGYDIPVNSSLVL